jgi:hypothetical protein
MGMGTGTAATLFLTLCALLCVSHSVQAADFAFEKAQKLAKSSAFITQALDQLILEARKIHDPVLRDSALRILARPEFKFVSARISKESEIKKELSKEGLFDGKGSLFPVNDPMPFNLAPAGIWYGHHSYPGGLVIHTWTNLLHALSLSKDWKKVQGVQLNEDWLRAAVIWHDSAKTMTLSWNEDGSDTLSEEEIAGTGAHHIFGITEAAFRELPVDFILILASAHSPPHPEAGLQAVIKYLKAAAIIAGKPYSVVGLDPTGKTLLKSPPLECFIHHLSDHDWVATEPADRQVSERIEAQLNLKSHWERNRILSRVGELSLYETLVKEGESGFKKRVDQLKSTSGFQ